MMIDKTRNLAKYEKYEGNRVVPGACDLDGLQLVMSQFKEHGCREPVLNFV
jgi:hypothetical protein